MSGVPIALFKMIGRNYLHGLMPVTSAFSQQLSASGTKFIVSLNLRIFPPLLNWAHLIRNSLHFQKPPLIIPPFDGLQKDKHAAFGGLFWAEQVKYLSELRLPFRLVLDRYRNDRLIDDRILQKALSINNNESFKLTSVPTSMNVSSSDAEDLCLYLLEASDGKFLDVRELDLVQLGNDLLWYPNPKVDLVDATFTYSCEPKSSCIFRIIPDGKLSSI